MSMLRPEDLEAIDNTVYEPKKEELKARTLLSVKSDVPKAAETYSYDVMTRTGVAKIMSPESDDIPLVDADMERHTVFIYSILSGFRVSVQEVRQAQMAGRPIESIKAATTRRAIAEKENQLTWAGDNEHKIQGMINATGIQTLAVDDNSGGTSSEWNDKTGEEIVSDLRKARSKINALPGHKADTLVVTPESFEELEKPFNEYNNQTVLNYIESQGWFSRIETTQDLKGQGDGNTDCFLVFDGSEEVSQLLVSMDVTRHETEYKFPYNKVPFEERTGGVIMYYPMAVLRGDGV